MQSPLVPPNFTAALATTRELRDFYSSKVTEYSQLLEQAKSQLVHAEGLLAGLEQLQPLQSEPVANEPSLIHAVSHEEGKNGSSNNGFSSSQLAVELNGAKQSQTFASTATIPDREQELQLLPPYQHLDLSSAIALLLKEHSGRILKLDFIVRSLYGKLQSPQYEVISKIVSNALEQGVSEGKWDRDPYPHVNNADCYISKWESVADRSNDNDQLQADDEEIEIETVEQSINSDVQLVIPVEDTETLIDVGNDDDVASDPGISNYVTEEELYELVNSGVLTEFKLKKLAAIIKAPCYNNMRRPKTFIAAFIKHHLTYEVLDDFLNITDPDHL
ncbi:hypothetical protein Cri9333_0648 [Crinalium epipsammum PCC 9333]|uniref:Uncharacterized protein n=1 Tax=Crinalium epipsammum PCC 9333 TaxID=1173022 RepID=K9VWR8_9CYAN|nr:hypothetical protein [Crinalium epipsammum]AFZ11590.1 hypothetical protein Cri9333_0648 [Crinalium epipsammum PCC 9333]